MFKSNRKLIFKLAAVFVLAAGVFIAQESAKAASWCPICPWPYSCNWNTGECECDCPDIYGNCPASCA